MNKTNQCRTTKTHIKVWIVCILIGMHHYILIPGMGLLNQFLPFHSVNFSIFQQHQTLVDTYGISPSYLIGVLAIQLQLHQMDINSLRPRQNRRHFSIDVFKCIFLDENAWIPMKISLKFVPQVPINNIPALVQIMAWRRPGDEPLSGPMMVRLLTHICVIRPQWVNAILRIWQVPLQCRKLPERSFLTSGRWLWQKTLSVVSR